MKTDNLEVTKERIDKEGGSCNFCQRGVLRESGFGFNYPYDTIFNFKRKNASGLKASICSQCLEELKEKVDLLRNSFGIYTEDLEKYLQYKKVLEVNFPDLIGSWFSLVENENWNKSRTVGFYSDDLLEAGYGKGKFPMFLKRVNEPIIGYITLKEGKINEVVITDLNYMQL